jgi:hypothetical protein
MPFERHPFHRGGHDGADQSWFRSKLVSGKQFFCDHVDCSVCTFVEQVPG